jgi:hypothetical protein
MSQINDALKRASQAQEPPPMHQNQTGLEHVEEPAPKQSSSIPIVIFPILLFLILACAAFFLVRGMDRKKALPIQARETQSPAGQEESAADQEPTEEEPGRIAKPANAPAAVQPVLTTNAAPAVAAGVPAVAPGGFKVNSIFYKPKNPAAVVNSKMVFVGDRIGDAKVVAIEKDAVIIEVDGQKKALTLF